MTGELPRLKVNLSDAKYKALMRFIDVAIPKFGEEQTTAERAASTQGRPKMPEQFPRSGRLFNEPAMIEYHLEDEDPSSRSDSPASLEHDQASGKDVEAVDVSSLPLLSRCS